MGKVSHNQVSRGMLALSRPLSQRPGQPGRRGWCSAALTCVGAGAQKLAAGQSALPTG